MITYEEAAKFYDCSTDDLKYYQRLTGRDPRDFVSYKTIDNNLMENIRQTVNHCVIRSAWNCTLEDQTPSVGFMELCKKILTWEVLSEQ